MPSPTRESNESRVNRPLRVMFVLTSMPVGGAETLLAEIVRRMDRRRFEPEICCLKQLDTLGRELAREIPAHEALLAHKFDVRVLFRLRRLLIQRHIDAVITVGTGGDKMFWGRLAAWLAGVRVIAAALHSTGHPDRVERSNRLLAPLTDAFIAVAQAHGRYIAQHEGCPSAKVRVIPNGIDCDRFRDRPPRPALRTSLGLPSDGPVVGIVAALRPEKQHELFLRMAARVRESIPNALFLVVGDGPRRAELEQIVARQNLGSFVHFTGTRSDVEQLLPLLDAVVLTSKMEANPVSVLEAMAACRPVVVPRVGSLPEVVTHEQTGLLYTAGNEQELTGAVIRTLQRREEALARARRARQTVVESHSIGAMVGGYEQLIAETHAAKSSPRRAARPALPVRAPRAAATVRTGLACQLPALPLI